MATYPTEPKVVAATGSAGLAALFASYIVWQVGVLFFGATADAAHASDAVAAVPQPISALILALLPTLAAFVAGYRAPHAARPPEPVEDNAVAANPEVIVPGPLN